MGHHGSNVSIVLYLLAFVPIFRFSGRRASQNNLSTRRTMAYRVKVGLCLEGLASALICRFRHLAHLNRATSQENHSVRRCNSRVLVQRRSNLDNPRGGCRRNASYHREGPNRPFAARRRQRPVLVLRRRPVREDLGYVIGAKEGARLAANQLVRIEDRGRNARDQARNRNVSYKGTRYRHRNRAGLNVRRSANSSRRQNQSGRNRGCR